MNTYICIYKYNLHVCTTQEGNSVPQKLASAYRAFRAFCRDIGETPLVKHFTKDNLNWSSLRHFPDCSFKGADTRLLLGFILQVMRAPVVALDDVASEVLLAAEGIDEFLRLIFGTKDGAGCKLALLNRSEGTKAMNFLNVWIQKFYVCARLCYDKGLCYFKLTPKYHYLQHVLRDMQQQLSGLSDEDGYILSPGLFATQMAEDATGRSSRMSRTVHVRTTALRVAQKWLISVKLHWDENQ